MTIRPATPADHDQIAHICLLTGATGADATGLYSNDLTLADVYATPYLLGPGGFCLVVTGARGASGIGRQGPCRPRSQDGKARSSPSRLRRRVRERGRSSWRASCLALTDDGRSLAFSRRRCLSR